MVLGIFEGEIEIITNKQTYYSGEKITGRIKLTLNKSKQAKALRLQFYGEVPSRNSNKQRIQKREIIVSRNKTYPAGESYYDFELLLPNIPRNKIGASINVPDLAKGLMNTMVNVFDPVKRAIWYLDASLDLKMSFDINKRKLVNFQV